MSNILNNSDSSSLSSGLHFTLGEGDVYEFVLDGFFENKPREKKLLERLYNSGFLDLCNSHSYNDISNDLYTSIEVIKNNSGGFSCLLYPKELSKNLYGSITLFDEYLSKLIFPKEFYNGSVHYAFRKSLFAFESDYRKNLGEKYYLAIYGLLSLFVAIDKSLLLYKSSKVKIKSLLKFGQIYKLVLQEHLIYSMIFMIQRVKVVLRIVKVIN